MDIKARNLPPGDHEPSVRVTGIEQEHRVGNIPMPEYRAMFVVVNELRKLSAKAYPMLGGHARANLRKHGGKIVCFITLPRAEKEVAASLEPSTVCADPVAAAQWVWEFAHGEAGLELPAATPRLT